MITRRVIVASIALFATLFTISSYSAWWDKNDEETVDGDVTEIIWDDLIPNDFTPPENPFISMSQQEIDRLMDGSEESDAEVAKLQEAFNYSPVVPELNGKRIKIPAYITPLEFDGETLSEFLLVPFVGACIHVPPPPANQVVHAQSPEPIKLPNMYDPVWAIGTIHAETVKSELAESGYRLEVEKIMPYTGN